MKTKVHIYDDGGQCYDRYTVVPQGPDWAEGEWQMMLCLSHNPDNPQGVSQWSSGVEGPHLGERVAYADLPEHIQKHINRRVED